MFTRSTLAGKYADVVRQISEGSPREPEHNPPVSISDSGFESFVTAAHRILFDDLTWFGAMINQQTAEPWSIDETPDTLLRDVDGPDLGRTYRIHYNDLHMGRLQVGIGFSALLAPEEFSSDRSARAELSIEWLRFVPYEAAHGLVATLGFLTGQFEDRDTAYARAEAAATAALTGYLWESVRVDDVVLSFDYATEGPYEVVRHLNDHWKASGYDPLDG